MPIGSGEAWQENKERQCNPSLIPKIKNLKPTISHQKNTTRSISSQRSPSSFFVKIYGVMVIVQQTKKKPTTYHHHKNTNGGISSQRAPLRLLVKIRSGTVVVIIQKKKKKKFRQWYVVQIRSGTVVGIIQKKKKISQ